MTVSRECEYALRGMVALAGASRGRSLTLREVAARDGLPPGFLSKIFQKLLRHGLIRSHRGVQRGYTLARRASEITLRQILEAIEGPDLFRRCVFSHRRCGEENPCVIHPYWRRVRGDMARLFEEVHLRDLAASVRPRATEARPSEDGPDEPAWIRTKVRALYS